MRLAVCKEQKCNNDFILFIKRGGARNEREKMGWDLRDGGLRDVSKKGREKGLKGDSCKTKR
jgi:hypothetical protein